MTNAQNRPSKKQRELLTFVENFISGHGYGPSYREIRAGMGYNSIATVALHIDSLITKGYLAKNPKKARSLAVVGGHEDDFIAPAAEASSEKWLVKEIDRRFKEVEAKAKPTKKAVDDLYVLTGSLKVLGFEEAATSFIARLTEIKQKN